MQKIKTLKRGAKRRLHRLRYRKNQLIKKIKSYFEIKKPKDDYDSPKIPTGRIVLDFLKFVLFWGFLWNYFLYFIIRPIFQIRIEFTVLTVLGYGIGWQILYNEVPALLLKCRER